MVDKVHTLKLESSGAQTRLICKDCERAFLIIENGELQFLSKHGAKQHENVLTRDHVRLVLFEMYRQSPPEPERW